MPRTDVLPLLQSCKSAGPGSAVVIGFDGFVDRIIDVVAQRSGVDEYAAMKTITELAGRVSAAAGKSTNLELVVRQVKIGGNGPIMAAAMARLDHPVDYIGLIGKDSTHPAFQPLAQNARSLVSLGDPAMTDALEFHDGKLMLGHTTALNAINPETLRSTPGLPALKTMIQNCACLGTVNWTMTMKMTKVWQFLDSEIFAGLTNRAFLFVDLCDPSKRSKEDLLDALKTLQKMEKRVRVVLGVNEREAELVSAALDLPWPTAGDATAKAMEACRRIREHLDLDRVVAHLIPSAASATREGTFRAEGFPTATPLITTGGGDHFNAGYVTGMVRGLPEAQSLLLGNAVSGTYVRSAVSPTWKDLVAFLSAV